MFNLIGHIAHLISRKHIVVVGKSEPERRKFINELLPILNYETIRFPKGIKGFDDYIETVRKESLFHPSFPSRGNYNANQVFDYHTDWIAENNTLLVLEEVSQMEEIWKIELLRIFIEELEKNKNRTARLLISQAEDDDLVSKLILVARESKHKSGKQIIESNLAIINIS